MARRAESGRRLWLILGLAVAGTLFAGGLALAASQTIVGQGNNTYSAPTYVTDQGEVVPFQVAGSSHNVTANAGGPDGKALFRSATISAGATPVNGTQYLTSGNYTFICTIHPTTMQATLVVTGSGTPQPRPHADLRVRSRKLSKVAKKGVLIGINASTKVDDVSLVAKLGKATLGRSGGVSLASGQQFEVIKLSRSGRRKLSGRTKAAIRVTADIPFGSPASGKAKLS